MSRKRRRDRPRTKSGQLSRAYLTIARDYGTPEAQAKRLALVGENADPALSASAPGILFARQMLDRDQYGKALAYRALRCVLYGAPFPSASDIKRGVDGGYPTTWVTGDAHLKKTQKLLRRLEAKITREQRRVVANVAVFDQLPRPSDLRELTIALDSMP